MEKQNKYDPIEKIIFQSGLRITSVEIGEEENTLNVLLNTGVSFSIPISNYRLLATGTTAQLKNYELIADGVGVHWNDLDEDLSLKGFLQKQNIL